jgi:hypothetical protein
MVSNFLVKRLVRRVNRRMLICMETVWLSTKLVRVLPCLVLHTFV